MNHVGPNVCNFSLNVELDSYYRSSSNGLCRLDTDLRFIHLNQNMADISNLSIDAHYGQCFRDVNSAIAPEIEKVCREVLDSGEAVTDLEIFNEAADIKWKHLKVHCVPVMNEEEVIGIGMVFQDVTEITERLDFMKLLSELSARFVNLSHDIVEPEVEKGLESLARTVGVDYAGLHMVMDDNRMMLVIEYFGTRELAEMMDMNNYRWTELFAPWFGGQLREGNIVQYENLEDLPEEARTEREFINISGMKSLLTIPLSVGGKIRYALSLETFYSHKVFVPDMVQNCKLVGEIFAGALERRKAEIKILSLQSQLEAELAYLKDEIKLLHNFEEIIGQSKEMKMVYSKIEKIAPLNTTVLITGETGTGKELVARAIHHLSPKSKRPMVKVNCASLPANLIESELFGHEKGAFSGAHAKKEGRFELADGSTIFLDEIGELPLELQAKLLRVIQEGEFERVGGTRTIKTDARIIAATNRNLVDEVENNQFRKDLWYRLNVFPIEVPPLRSRKDDISLLIWYFIEKLGKKVGTEITKIPKKTLKKMENYSWPGNVRELENVVERSLLSSPGDSLVLADKLSSAEDDLSFPAERKTLDELQREYIIETLKETEGRIHGSRGAAVLLGINPDTLRSRIRKLGIKKDFL